MNASVVATMTSSGSGGAPRARAARKKYTQKRICAKFDGFVTNEKTLRAFPEDLRFFEEMPLFGFG
jgi:hypothetical protein